MAKGHWKAFQKLNGKELLTESGDEDIFFNTRWNREKPKKGEDDTIMKRFDEHKRRRMAAPNLENAWTSTARKQANRLLRRREKWHHMKNLATAGDGSSTSTSSSSTSDNESEDWTLYRLVTCIYLYVYTNIYFIYFYFLYTWHWKEQNPSAIVTFGVAIDSRLIGDCTLPRQLYFDQHPYIYMHITCIK